MAVFVLPLAVFMAVKLAFTIMPRYAKVRELRSILNTVAQENIEANRVVRAFVREDFEREKMWEASENFRQEQFNVNRVWRRYMPFLSNMQLIFTIYNIVAGGILVINGTISMGDLVMFNGMVWMITGPLTQYGFLANDAANCIASTQKMMELLNTDTEIKPVTQHPIKKHIRGDIDFINVSFGYDGDEHALHHVSFQVKAGETIGLIGTAGSGKSTIINLISRFYDVDHEMCIRDRYRTEQKPKSRLIAGLLGVLVGSFGIHRLYLGDKTIALVQLVVTIITCGVGGLWGVIEGLLLLYGKINKDAYGNPLEEF